MDEFAFYNRHYIRCDDRDRIVDAWSDGPHPEKDVTAAICINDKGGYQLRLIIDGQLTEENPPLWTMDGIPLYKWNGAVKPRTAEEIEADRAAMPPAPPSEQERVRADVDFLLAIGGYMV